MSDDKPKYRWTVMVYLAGDNNLTDECVHALTQMKEAADLQDICVIAQFDPKGGRLKSHRYEISNVSKKPALSDDFLKLTENKKKFRHRQYRDFAALRRPHARSRGGLDGKEEDETNTGSPVTLFDFVTWGIENYRAESYMLVISGHGGGPRKGYLLRDEDPADALTLWELQVALEAIRDEHGVVVDILGMDCCLMTMAEVSYQLKGLARLVVGSEGYSPIAGWPFKPVLERMRKELARIEDDDAGRRREREGVAVARGVVEEYVDYYLPYTIGGLSVEMAALNLDEVDGLKEKVDALARTLTREFALKKERKSEDFIRAIVFAHWRAQSFNGERFVDLYDFCGLLKSYYPEKDVVDACDGVLSTESKVVVGSCYSGPTYQHAHGLSLYFPWAEIDADYYAVRFSRDISVTPNPDSPWMEFLKTYVVETRRLPRDRGTELHGNNDDPYAMRHAPGRHAPGKALLPDNLSMRNPPLAAGLSPCISELREHKRESLAKMSESLTHRVTLTQVADDLVIPQE